jgi:hypothetical protein
MEKKVLLPHLFSKLKHLAKMAYIMEQTEEVYHANYKSTSGYY